MKHVENIYTQQLNHQHRINGGQMWMQCLQKQHGKISSNPPTVQERTPKQLVCSSSLPLRGSVRRIPQCHRWDHADRHGRTTGGPQG